MEPVTLNIATLFTAGAALVAIVVFAIRTEGRTNANTQALEDHKKAIERLDKQVPDLREELTVQKAKVEMTQEFMTRLESQLETTNSRLGKMEALMIEISTRMNHANTKT